MSGPTTPQNVEENPEGTATDSGENGDNPRPAEKPVSLHPLEFEEAVAGLLKVGKKGASSKMNTGQKTGKING